MSPLHVPLLLVWSLTKSNLGHGKGCGSGRGVPTAMLDSILTLGCNIGGVVMFTASGLFTASPWMKGKFIGDLVFNQTMVCDFICKFCLQPRPTRWEEGNKGGVWVQP